MAPCGPSPCRTRPRAKGPWTSWTYCRAAASSPSGPRPTPRGTSSSSIRATPRPPTYHSPRVSPDGRRVALDFAEVVRDVWVLDLDDRTLSRATFQKTGHDPTWMPDGKELIFAEMRGPRTGVMQAPLDGSRP